MSDPALSGGPLGSFSLAGGIGALRVSLLFGLTRQCLGSVAPPLSVRRRSSYGWSDLPLPAPRPTTPSFSDSDHDCAGLGHAVSAVKPGWAGSPLLFPQASNALFFSQISTRYT